MTWPVFFALLIGLSIGTWGGQHTIDALREMWDANRPQPARTRESVNHPHVRLLPAVFDQDRQP